MKTCLIDYMRFGLIYRATSPSGKVYIGSTITALQTRINSHRHEAKVYRTNSKFSKALRKYGKQIRWEILHRNIPENILKHLELYEIEYHDSFKRGYNSSMDGRSGMGFIHSTENRIKQSERMKGSKNPFYNKKHPQELLTKWRLERRGQTRSDQFKQRRREIMKFNNPTLGRNRTEEEKLKMSEGRPKVTYRISNTLIDEFYDVITMKELDKWTRHHWNRSGRYILNTKKFHCYIITTI